MRRRPVSGEWLGSLEPCATVRDPALPDNLPRWLPCGSVAGNTGQSDQHLAELRGGGRSLLFWQPVALPCGSDPVVAVGHQASAHHPSPPQIGQIFPRNARHVEPCRLPGAVPIVALLHMATPPQAIPGLHPPTLGRWAIQAKMGPRFGVGGVLQHSTPDPNGGQGTGEASTVIPHPVPVPRLDQPC